MKIAGWTKLSFCDFPGKVSTVIFCAGCNLRCPYCHNPGVVRDELPAIEFSPIADYLEIRKNFIEAVVVSGGEPAIQQELPLFLGEVRRFNVKIKIDTNGLLPEIIEQCRPDYIALDIKTIPARYRELGCAYDNVSDRLSRSLQLVRDWGDQAEVRITMVPGLIDGPAIAELAPMLHGVRRIWLQQFRNRGPLLNPACEVKKPFSEEELQRLAALLGPVCGNVGIRGID